MRADIFAYAVIATGAYVATRGWPDFGIADFVALALFGLLLLWLTGKRKARGHHGSNDGVAFRLGKTLKGIVRPKRL